MDIQKIISIAEIIIAVLLVASILLQRRGAGSSAIMGGSGGASYYTKRGFEKVLFWSTIILAIAFLTLALSSTIIITRL